MAKGLTRRAALGAMAAPALLGLHGTARADTRIAEDPLHQFPGSGPEGGDSPGPKPKRARSSPKVRTRSAPMVR